MKKLAYVITQSELGGAQKNIILLASKLKYYYDITVYSAPDGAMVEELVKLGINFVPVQSLVREIDPVNDLKTYMFFVKEFKNKKYDIVHSHSSKAGILARLAAQSAGVKNNVYTAHGFVFKEPMNNLKRNLYIFLERYAAKKSSTLICVSPEDIETAKKFEIKPKNKTYYIPNGIDFSQVKIDKALLRDELGISVNDFVFGFVANFYETKGHRYLIEAFNELNKMRYSTKLVLVGDGVLSKEMEKLADNNPNIIFLGYRNDAEKIVNIFDCFVMSSVKEGFPFAILEAIKSKVPVIATNVGAIPEILEQGRLGLICDSKDVDSLINNMTYAIENKEEIIMISEKAYENSKNKYSLEKMIELTKSAYESNS